MKSLDPGTTGIEFIAEGLALIFSLESELADFLAKIATAHIGDLLIERKLNQARQDGASDAEMAFLQNVAAYARQRGPDGTPIKEVK
jgi:hypothetical protein